MNKIRGILELYLKPINDDFDYNRAELQIINLIDGCNWQNCFECEIMSDYEKSMAKMIFEQTKDFIIQKLWKDSELKKRLQKELTKKKKRK